MASKLTELYREVRDLRRDVEEVKQMRIPEVAPTKADRQSIARGRREFSQDKVGDWSEVRKQFAELLLYRLVLTNRLVLTFLDLHKMPDVSRRCIRALSRIAACMNLLLLDFELANLLFHDSDALSDIHSLVQCVYLPFESPV